MVSDLCLTIHNALKIMVPSILFYKKKISVNPQDKLTLRFYQLLLTEIYVVMV